MSDCRCIPPHDLSDNSWLCEHGAWQRRTPDPPLPTGGRTWQKVTSRHPRASLLEQEAMANIGRTGLPGAVPGHVLLALVDRRWASWHSNGRWQLTDTGSRLLAEAVSR